MEKITIQNENDIEKMINNLLENYHITFICKDKLSKNKDHNHPYSFMLSICDKIDYEKSDESGEDYHSMYYSGQSLFDCLKQIKLV